MKQLKIDIENLIEEKLSSNNLDEANSGGTSEFRFGLPFNYELIVYVEKKAIPQTSYNTKSELYTSDGRLLATKQNECFDACNLSDQLCELASELVDLSLINEEGLERESNEFKILLYRSPDEETCSKLTLGDSIYCHNNPLVSVKHSSFYPDQNEEGSYISEFLIQTKDKTKSCHLDGNVGLSFDNHELLGTDLFIDPIVVVLD